MRKSIAIIALALALAASTVRLTAQATESATALTAGEIVAAQAGKVPDGGGVFETPQAWVHLYYGEHGGDTYEFTDVRGGGTGLGSAETYGLSGYTSCHINQSLMRVSIRYGLIFEFRFKENVFFTVEHPAGTLNTTTRKLTVTQFLSDGENEIVLQSMTLPAQSGSVAVAENAMGVSAHVQAGDVFTLTLESKNYDGLTLNGVLPRFLFDPAGYAPEERYDFTALKAYKAAVSAAADRLQAHYDALDKALYSFDNRLLLIDILDRALGACETLTPETDLTAFEARETAKLDAVPTLAEEAAELAEYKAEKAAELDAFVKGLKKSRYSGKNYRAILAYLDEGKQKIEAASTNAGVIGAFNAAAAKIEAVETGGNLAPLWWTLGAVGAAVIAAVIVSVWLRRRKHEKSK